MVWYREQFLYKNINMIICTENAANTSGNVATQPGKLLSDMSNNTYRGYQRASMPFRSIDKSH